MKKKTVRHKRVVKDLKLAKVIVRRGEQHNASITAISRWIAHNTWPEEIA